MISFCNLESGFQVLMYVNVRLMLKNKWPEFVFTIIIKLFSGHFYLGTALLELDKLDEAILHLQTAFELTKKEHLIVILV